MAVCLLCCDEAKEGARGEEETGGAARVVRDAVPWYDAETVYCSPVPVVPGTGSKDTEEGRTQPEQRQETPCAVLRGQAPVKITEAPRKRPAVPLRSARHLWLPYSHCAPELIKRD